MGRDFPLMLGLQHAARARSRRTRPKSLTPKATYLCFREKLAGMRRKFCLKVGCRLMLACGAVFEFLQNRDRISPNAGREVARGRRACKALGMRL